MKTSIYLFHSILFSSAVCSLSAKEKPNIIFIYADDLGYGDLGCYGSKVNRTPNLDQMASEGIQFTDLYSACSISSPSRAGLLTGRHPVRMGIHSVFFPGSYTGIPTTEVTLAQKLQENGYHTGIVGKWHLGHMQQFRPLQRGFDEYFGIPYSNDMNPCIYMDGNEAGTTLVNQDSITYTYTTKALDFIERNQEKPFFLYLAHNMPHIPLAASANFRGKSANGLYGDVIEELDWGIGQVLNKVKECGLDENTIIIFSSDNGPWLTEGPMGGVATPLFQGKGTTWEGGQRVPALIRWKGTIPAGKVYQEMVTMLDWFPTLVNIGGGQTPTDRMIDGKDISPILLNPEIKEEREFPFIEFGRIVAYRKGDWKLILPEDIRKGNYWVADVPAHETLLFNLRTDIGEQTDLSAQYPEKVKELTAALEKFKATIKDAPPALFTMEWQTPQLVSKQRQEAIENHQKK
ncbi:sulfatase [Parabacteroides sp. PF5-9]|uniref:sulfatase family protein n=1 Tax=Parabacteroides sp. PF5-9 TaxID=1742404 RepID=UPI002475E725|nr:sulfatase [Parabacteroides sp. PF5-9]MDH6357519.1 arylsulfatase A [Parabacteroides sp. PF5-9]